VTSTSLPDAELGEPDGTGAVVLNKLTDLDQVLARVKHLR
jgi:hypothetical protein